MAVSSAGHEVVGNCSFFFLLPPTGYGAFTRCSPTAFTDMIWWSLVCRFRVLAWVVARYGGKQLLRFDIAIWTHDRESGWLSDSFLSYLLKSEDRMISFFKQLWIYPYSGTRSVVGERHSAAQHDVVYVNSRGVHFGKRLYFFIPLLGIFTRCSRYVAHAKVETIIYSGAQELRLNIPRTPIS